MRVQAAGILLLMLCISGCMDGAPTTALSGPMSAAQAWQAAAPRMAEGEVRSLTSFAGPSNEADGLADLWAFQLFHPQGNFSLEVSSRGVERVPTEGQFMGDAELRTPRFDSPDAMQRFWTFYEEERPAFDAAPYRAWGMVQTTATLAEREFWLVIVLYGESEHDAEVLTGWIDMSTGEVRPDVPGPTDFWLHRNGLIPGPLQTWSDTFDLDAPKAVLRVAVTPTSLDRGGPLGLLGPLYPSVPLATVQARFTDPAGTVHSFQTTLASGATWEISRADRGPWSYELSSDMPTGADISVCTSGLWGRDLAPACM